MRNLLATTCLSSLAWVAMTAPAHGETAISTARTTAVNTATANAGAADDVKITSAGSITLTSDVAVTIDSANKVVNEGTVKVTNADDAVGILASAASGSITNTGTITIDETYTPTDADSDGDLDGPFAAGARRFGIRTAGAFSGAIVNSGTITIEGNDSAGIALGGPLTGSLSTDGTITVTGDRSVGVRAGAVTGPVRIAGTITARGQGAMGAALEGDITGALVVQGAISASGYRSITLPTDTSKLDADDLLQGGPALSISANVTGGVILAVPPKDNSTTDNDEDKDGIEDSKEGSAAITSYGAAPAVQIGSATRSVTLGPVAGTGTGHGLVIDGTVTGLGVYSGVDGNGLVIGGLGGDVSIAGGVTVNGLVQASSNGANATALKVGSDATVPEIRIGGTIAAAGGGVTGTRSTGILIDTGATVGTVRNNGQITVTTSGTSGAATAILDLSGGLALVENSGAISVSGADTTSDRNIAIDLRANNGGATVRQTAVTAGVTAPSISGDILFGAGNDLLDIADGKVTGTSRFGNGDNRLTLSGDGVYSGTSVFGAGNDIMTLAGTSAFSGTAEFGGGADALTLNGTSTFSGTADFGGGADMLTLNGTSRFTGTLANSSGLAVNVAGGTLDLSGSGAVQIGSLSVGSQGVLAVTVDTESGTNTLFNVAGNASFASGSKVAVRLTSISESEGQFVIVRAGSVTGAENLATSADLLPFLYKSSIVTSAPNELSIDIERKTATELGLNGSQGRAYNAIYAALDKDEKVADVFLSIADGDTFRRSLRQMLPDHAGGTFEAVTAGSRATAAMLADPNAPFSDQGRWGFWIQQVGWGTSRSMGDTAGYDITGWGASGGAEAKTGAGNFGLSIAYLNGRDADGGTDNEVNASQYEIAGYWRGSWGGLHAHARASAAHIGFTGKRHFVGTIGTEAVERTASGKWNGRLMSASGGLSYELRAGMLSFRPIAAVDYYRLREKGYSETGGGNAFNLTVDSRSSDELAVTGSLAAGLDFGGYDREAGWFRVEVEGGRRQLVGGSLGNTTARFADGDTFELIPDARTNGWVAKLRGVGGNSNFQLGGEVGAEEQQGRAAIALRASLKIGL